LTGRSSRGSHGLGLVGLGLGVGLLGARALERGLSSVLYGVQPGEAATTVTAATLFVAVALVAILVPARRATRIDPLAAIRSE
jgi:putative ABC transport system permease protein